MTDFAIFARDHGLIVRHIIADGRVHRVPTEAHPHKRNGAYAYDGVKGFVQAWELHDQAIPFHNGADRPAVPVRPAPAVDRADRARAAEFAQAIVRRCTFTTHPYLAAKGFPNEQALVDSDGRMVVPMFDARRYGSLLSVQHITVDGAKKFLAGGRAKEAVFHLGRGDSDVLVEGYATALSVRAALAALYRAARVVVCFSAGNLAAVARLYRGLVVADNDASNAGQRAAEQSGLPWVMPPDVGQDANDLHQARGLGALCELLRTA